MGARGLMQIMEETFSWLSRYRLFERDMVFDDMFIPDENIRYGCYLIRYHLNQYGENTEHAMAAYFAGDQNMNRWLLAGEITDPDTNHYINKVKTAYDNYNKLYKENKNG
jgi:soluble lytic murein transglycosylase